MIELAGIIILGILAQWVAWRFKIPAILPLILIGLLVGPIASEFLTDDKTKYIEPIWNGTKGLFPGDSLYYFVSSVKISDAIGPTRSPIKISGRIAGILNLQATH